MIRPLAIWLLFLSSFGFTQVANQYAIASFRLTSISYPQPSSTFIRRPASEPLLELDMPPAQIRPGELVMRKKINGEYKLYSGYIDTTAFHAFPPMNSFPIPSWSKSGEVIWHRIYPAVFDNPNMDLETVYFDDQHIYVPYIDKIHLFHNDKWIEISGLKTAPIGRLDIHSNPEGAQIFLFGKSTGLKTPATINGLITGNYEVELFLPEYSFQRKVIKVFPDSTVSSSFELFSDFDTLLVLGQNQHGMLALPYPPIDNPYLINDSAVTSVSHLLAEGEYHLRWSGSKIYRDLDTTIFIPAGRMVFFNIPFKRLTGKVRFELTPEDAMVCLEGRPCSPGSQTVELPSGLYLARISKRGYDTEKRKFLVSPDKIAVITSELIPNADNDGDGYPDSVDNCPEIYGLYDGCPKQRFRDAWKIKTDEVKEYVRSEPVSFAISGLGMITRIPTRKRFNTFLSAFSGGRVGGVNNYRGLTAGNQYQISYRGLMLQTELGQWSSGLRYKRPDTLVIRTVSDQYLIWYDSLYDVTPAIFIPSTALSFGFKYRLLNYSFSYCIGYQWEDIIVDQIQSVFDGDFKRVQFDNDWWYHELGFEADLFTDTKITPSGYAKIKFPFGPILRTRWHVLQMGIQLRFRPTLKKKL